MLASLELSLEPSLTCSFSECHEPGLGLDIMKDIEMSKEMITTLKVFSHSLLSLLNLKHTR